MAWQTPKTDWYGEVIEGVYVGDRFNAVDYNRIKNNLIYLRDLAITVYESFNIETVSNDKTTADFFYADEINAMERNLDTINNNTLIRNYGTRVTFSANGNTPVYTELNRLESAILDLYDRLSNQSEGRRMFTWNFGMKGGL